MCVWGGGGGGRGGVRERERERGGVVNDVDFKYR